MLRSGGERLARDAGGERPSRRSTNPAGSFASPALILTLRCEATGFAARHPGLKGPAFGLMPLVGGGPPNCSLRSSTWVAGRCRIARRSWGPPGTGSPGGCGRYAFRTFQKKEFTSSCVTLEPRRTQPSQRYEAGKAFAREPPAGERAHRQGRFRHQCEPPQDLKARVQLATLR